MPRRRRRSTRPRLRRAAVYGPIAAMPISARDPSALPSPAILKRRCAALARLDRVIDPDADVPTHDVARGGGTFWLRESEGNHVQIAFMRAGVVILGFDHESPMSPAGNGERVWPGVVDALPAPLRRALRDHAFGDDITFCVWRQARDRRWHSGPVRRPRGRDVDGSARLLAILDGDPLRYRRFARAVHDRDVPLAAIARAYAGHPVDRAAVAPAAPPAPASAPRAARAPPRFAIGDRVIDPWGYRGKVTAITHGLAAAAAAGEIGDVDRWLRGLSVKPKTPRRGIWYSVRPSSGGEILVGELDLRRAPG